MFPALLTTFLFAHAAVCATQVARVLGGLGGNFARLCLAVLVLGVVYWFSDTKIIGGAAWLFAGAGAIGFGMGGTCMFQAFPRLGSTLSLLVVECAAAVSTMLLGWLWLGAAIAPLPLAFALLSIAGVVLGLWPQSLPDIPSRVLVAGVAFAVAASVAQTFSFILSKQAFLVLAQSGAPASPFSAAFVRMLGGFGVALVMLTALGVGQRIKGQPLSIRNSLQKLRQASPWVLANALAGPILGVTCMLWAIREVGNPGLVQVVVATATLVSVPIARLTEKRRLRGHYFLGATLSICGTAGLLLTHPSP